MVLYLGKPTVDCKPELYISANTSLFITTATQTLATTNVYNTIYLLSMAESDTSIYLKQLDDVLSTVATRELDNDDDNDTCDDSSEENADTKVTCMDYLIVFAECDRARAEDLHLRLQTEKYTGRLVNENTAHIGNVELFYSAACILFCVSLDLVKAGAADFINKKCRVLERSVTEKMPVITYIPVWFGRRSQVRKQCGDMIFGLSAMNGFNYDSKYFLEEVNRMFRSKQFIAQKKQNTGILNNTSDASDSVLYR